MQPARVVPPIAFHPVPPPARLSATAEPVTNAFAAANSGVSFVCDSAGRTLLEVKEGEPFVVRVAVTADVPDTSLEGLNAWFYLSPDGANASVTHGDYTPKTLTEASSRTPVPAAGAQQQVTATLRASVSGDVGVYELRSVVGGLVASWTLPGAAQAACAAPISQDGMLLVRVTSSVHRVVATPTPRVWLPPSEAGTEYLFAPFVTTPTLLVLGGPQQANSKPLAGKRALLVPTAVNGDSSASALEAVTFAAKSTVSGADGRITFALAAVTALGHPDGSNVTFAVVVDGVTSLTFNRTIVHQFTRAMPGHQTLTTTRAALSSARSCAAVVVVDTVGLSAVVPGSTQHPTGIQVRALDVFGAPVANAEVLAMVSTKSGAFLSDNTVRNTTAADGTAWLTRPVTSFFGESEVFVEMVCAGLRESPSIVALAERRVTLRLQQRVRAAHVTSVSSTAGVRVALRADWSEVSTASPIDAFLFPVWTPWFIAAYYPVERRFTNTSHVRITQRPPTGSNDEVVIPPGSPAVALPGVSVYAAFIDGASLNTFMPTAFRPRVVRVELQRSAISSVPRVSRNATVTQDYLDLAFGAALPTQPIVRALDSNGVPVPTEIVFAQLGIDLPRGSGGALETQWIDVLSDPAAIAYGGIADAGNAAASSTVPEPPTAVTDGSGVATFASLRFEGAAVDRPLRLRYCVAASLPVIDANEPSQVAVVDTCVEEAEVFRFPPWQAVVATVSPPTLALVPGAFLPEIGVRALASTSGPVSIVAANVLPHASIRNVQSALRVDSSRSAVTVMTIAANTLQVSETAGTSLITLGIAVPGARATIAITVTTVATELALVLPPPGDAALDAVQNIAVRVSGAGALPLPQQKVSVGIRRSANDGNECEGSGCGVQATSALTQGITDADGVAFLAVVFSDATSGAFSYTFNVDPPPPDIARLQEALSGDVDGLLGAVGDPAALLALSDGDTTAVTATVDAISTGGVAKLTSQLGRYNLDPELVAAFAGAAASAAANPDAVASASTRLEGVADAGGRDGEEDRTVVTSTVTVHNPVSSVMVISDPAVDHLEAIASQNAANSSYRSVWTWTATQQPVFQLLDSAGRPVPDAPVTLSLISDPDDADVRLDLVDAARLSDAEGMVYLAGSSLSTTTSDVSVYIRATSRGSPSNTTTEKTTIRTTRATLAQTLQLFAFLLVFLFAPLFLSSVAHSRNLYVLGGTVFTIVMAAITSAYMNILMRDFATNSMAQTYFIFTAIVAYLAAIGMIVILVTNYLAPKFPRFRVWNAEERSVGAFKYTVWLTNARVDKQPLEDEQPTVAERVRSFFRRAFADTPAALTPADAPPPESGANGVGDDNGRFAPLNDKEDGMVVTSVGTVSPKSATEHPNHAGSRSRRSAFEDRDPHERSANSRRFSMSYADSMAVEPGSPLGDHPFRTRERPALVRPDDVPDPTYYPTNLFVVLSISLVLVVLMVFFTVQLMIETQTAVTQAVNILPDIPDDPAILRNATRKLTDGMTMMLEAAATADENLAFLRDSVGPIRDADVVGFLITARRFLDSFSGVVTLGYSVGMSFGVLFVLVCMVYAVYITPVLIRKMRRGEMRDVPVYNDPQPFRIEQFIGLFVFHFVAVYIMVSSVAAFVTWLLAVDPIRELIFRELWAAFLASAGSIVLTFALRFFQEFFLMDGTLVVRPRMYALYSLIDLVLGVFTGLFNTIVRMAMAIGFVIAGFAKLDETIYPSVFGWLDTGLIGFSSLLTMEARNCNPVYLSAASYLLTVQALKRTAAQYQARHEMRRLGVRDALDPALHGPAMNADSETKERHAHVATDKRLQHAAWGERWVASEVNELVERHLNAVRIQESDRKPVSWSGGGFGSDAIARGGTPEEEPVFAFSALDAGGDGDEGAKQRTEQCGPTIGTGTIAADALGADVPRVRVLISAFGIPTKILPKDSQAGQLATPLDLLKANGTAMPSPIMVNLARTWLRWLGGPRAHPLEPWIAEGPEQEATGRPRADLFDVTAFLARPRQGRMARKWHLAVTLLRNPSLIPLRKHWLPRDPDAADDDSTVRGGDDAETKGKCRPPCC